MEQRELSRLRDLQKALVEGGEESLGGRVCRGRRGEGIGDHDVESVGASPKGWGSHCSVILVPGDSVGSGSHLHSASGAFSAPWTAGGMVSSIWTPTPGPGSSEAGHALGCCGTVLSSTSTQPVPLYRTVLGPGTQKGGETPRVKRPGQCRPVELGARQEPRPHD